MSAEDHFQLRVSALFRQGLQAEGVCRATELRGASEVWPTKGTAAAPAWYVWLTSSPGAFALRLETAESVVVEGMPFYRGLLTLQYFASPAEPLFSLLAPEQQDLLVSPVFDETNTPVFDCGGRVPSDWFGVGMIEVFESPDLDTSILMLAGSDPFGGAPIPPLPAVEGEVPPLPVWQLAYPLFEAMIGLNSYLRRDAPARIVCSRCPGIDGAPGLKAALVGFLKRNRTGEAAAVDRLEAILEHDPWRPICRFPVRQAGEPDCRDRGRYPHADCHDHHQHRDHHASIPLCCSETWWTLAAIEERVAALPCGCH